MPDRSHNAEETNRPRRRKPPKPQIEAEFANYVPHPRYGQGPWYTKLVCKERDTAGWRSTVETRVSGTGVRADQSRQAGNTYAVVGVYFDERRVCVSCGRPFLFSADEQKHWCETLGFTLNSDCIHCWPCRFRQQRRRARRMSATERYAALAQIARPTREQLLELLKAGIELLEMGEMGRRATQRLRAVLNKLWPRGSDAPERAVYEQALAAAAPPGT